MDTKRNYINGEWVDGPDVLRNINPSNLDDLISLHAQADAVQTRAAIDAAHDAFPSWAASSPEVRADALDRIGTEIFARKDELGELLSREEGKPRAEGIAEVTRAARVFKFFAGEALRPGGEAFPSVRQGCEVSIQRVPEGVVGIIAPWNFPIAIPSWKIAPALAFGNTVVFKPAELVPGSAWELASIISRSGIPAGVFNLVTGPGSQVGATLVSSPKVRALSFTGSNGTGKRIAIECVTRGAKVQTEMGGKNPLIVLDDARLDEAVEVALNGAYYSTGQRCTASSRLIVTEGIHDRFVQALSERIRSLRVGHALAPETQIGPVVSEDQLQQDLSYVELGISEGARLVTGGTPVQQGTRGYFLAPALFTESTNDMRLNREEIFGPVAAVIRVKDYEEAVEVANDTEFGLSSGICTTSLTYASDFRRRSAAGMTMVNLPTAGVDYHAPFGGRKNSSYGAREQGAYAREFYTSVRTAYVKP
ncbi:aldehyde dehydrogenase family protein [Paraburkholderia hospita]|uniref:aldehyde dehydrogenase family protein n=1 Tax=Paraburkholderia hospita TaxID=169430 RepID=UPI000B342981|nr:aldehyde dehydrogenase family protein [Paraburkholderia hospita]OUL81078.1 aldehyde dehydrogenase family protein [Paraburkholderia hospita]